MRLLGVLAVGAASCVACWQAIGAESVRCVPDNFLVGPSFLLEANRNDSGWSDDFRDQAKRAASMGASSIQVEVSWSHVMRWNLGTRRMEVDAGGIAAYHALFDDLRAYGVKPIVTLFNGELPQELSTQLDPPGWLHHDIVEHFEEFAGLVFQEFGANSKYWITFNDPSAAIAYYPVSEMMQLAARHVLLAHARSVKLFRALITKGKAVDGERIGMKLRLDAARRAAEALAPDWFLVGLVTGKLLSQTGRWQESFTLEEAALVKRSYDMLVFSFDEPLLEYRDTIAWVHDQDQDAAILLIDNSRSNGNDSARVKTLQDSVHGAMMEHELTIVGFVMNTDKSMSESRWPARAATSRCMELEKKTSTVWNSDNIIKDILWSLSVMLGVVVAGASASLVTGSLRAGAWRRMSPTERTSLLV